MSLLLLTDGLGLADVATGSLYVTNFVPLTGTTIYATSSIGFDVLNGTGSLRIDIVLTGSFGRIGPSIVYDGNGFIEPYNGASSIAAIAAGQRFVVKQTGSWPAGTAGISVSASVAGG